MTALFLIFALTTSALVYHGTLHWLRAHPLRASTLNRALIAAFLLMAVICVWIGHSLGRIHYQP
jgi:hypothetical protein